MKLYSRIIYAIFIILLFNNIASAQTEDWNIHKSKHFIIYYKDAPKKYINEVTRKAERYYNSITDYLGFRRFKFWTWEKRCNIYFYPDREGYLKDTPGEQWSRGSVQVIDKDIVTYLGEEEFFDHILPHEMGHIIFREGVGFDTHLPLWIDEAVAVLQEKDRAKYIRTAKKIVKDEKHIGLRELSETRNYKEINPLIFYSEAASIIDFLLQEFGRDEFVIFCRRLRDGEDWEGALLRTYKFESLEELEKAWVEFVK